MTHTTQHNSSPTAPVLPIEDHQIPVHLAYHIVQQQPELYTAIDHASWRFIMALSKVTLGKIAHEQYIEGLEKTGIHTERIPLITEMDACLRRFGWRAVAVSGFIPPAAFMEFQSLRILPIACDMRKLENLGYTPAPDIVHEAAGHAPMIANDDYAQYLQQYGQVAKKAIYSQTDEETYLAIRNLSEVKENPFATEEDILQAEERLLIAESDATYLSEGSQLARFYWWTVEYGLIGALGNPKLYGAGLLSSVGESDSCLKPPVHHVPFSLDVINTAYDITRPQPQLFVASSFNQLSDALQTFAQTMAFKQGGMAAIAKALQAKTVTTTQLETGLQISGVLAAVTTNYHQAPIYMQWKGPCQLSVNDAQLPHHSPLYHASGYGCALGVVKIVDKPLQHFTPEDWTACGFELGNTHKQGRLEFESGVVLTGSLKQLLSHPQQPALTVLATFDQATVSYQDTMLFLPDWGSYDLACGSEITSVFGGPADWGAYYANTDDLLKAQRGQKNNATPVTKLLEELYQQVRELREALPLKEIAEKQLEYIVTSVSKNYPDDWLLKWEVFELCQQQQLNPLCLPAITSQLQQLASSKHPQARLLERILQVT